MKDKIEKALEEWKKIDPDKNYLKKRQNIQCQCKRQKTNEKDRVKFGTCRCDSYSLYHTLGKVISNSLYQYLADAKPKIVRGDWELIEKHAEAIFKYSTADSWDEFSKDRKEKAAYMKLKKDWKEAMKWLTENWPGLWW